MRGYCVGQIDELLHTELLWPTREGGLRKEVGVVGRGEGQTLVELVQQGLDGAAHHFAALVEGGFHHTF